MSPRQYVDRADHIGVFLVTALHARESRLRAPIVRRVVVSTELDWLEAKPEWAGLKAVAMVESTR